jgi:hypothetical protein
VSVFDNGDVICESSCDFDELTRVVDNIEIADNAEEADNADALTDEYIILSEGTELREEDGIKFAYLFREL